MRIPKFKLLVGMIAFAMGLVMAPGIAAADTTPYQNPSANDAIVGSVTSPTNGYAADNQYASYDNSDSNSYRGFGFAIPAGATINSIGVQVEGYRSGLSEKTFGVQLTYDAGAHWTASKNTGDMGGYSTTDRTVTLSVDNWGYASWTPEIINSSTNFRVRLTASAGYGGTVYLDNVRVLVNYTPLVAGPPTATSAATNGDGDVIAITFNKTMADPAGKHGQFSFQINGGAGQTPTAAALGATTNIIELTTGVIIASGNTVAVSYTAGNVTAADGQSLASFSGLSVQNNRTTYGITVNKVGTGTVTQNPVGPRYDSGTSVNLTATAGAGFTFTSWSGSGLSGNANPATLVMNSDKVVTATFTETPVTLTFNIVGSGYVSKNPDQTSYLPSSNTNVELTATAPPGWVFSAWSGNVTGSTNPTSILMNANRTVTATFTPTNKRLETNVTGSGTVTRSPDAELYTANTTVTVTANPSAGWSFVGWGGDLSGTVNPAQITLDENRVVNAVFVQPANLTKWWDTSWLRRKQITITELSGVDLTNYQVKIPVTFDSDMLGTFADIRFVAQDNTSELPYWVSSYTANTSAEFWVKVPFVPHAGQTQVFMYYKNASAASASNIHTTFIWGDDFNDATWTTANVHQWNAEAGGQMPIQEVTGGIYSQSGVTQAEPIAEIWNPATGGMKQFQGNYVSEVDFQPQTSASDYGGAYITGRYAGVEWKYEQLIDIQWDTAIINVVDGDIWYNLAAQPVLPTGTTVVPGSTWYRLRATLSREGATNRLAVHLNDVAQTNTTDTRLKFNGLAFLSYDFDHSFHVHYDNFRVREYATSEPTNVLGTEEVITPGATVNPTSGLTTTESGGTTTFTVVLNTHPSSDVTIGLTSSDTTEGTVSPASLVFTPSNWNTAQTVTITGVDDANPDGNIGYTIVTANTTSTDSLYSNLVVPDVSVTNQDNDTAGILVTPTAGLITTEAGASASFTVVLSSPPSANVTIALLSSDTTEGTVSPASLTFTTSNWNNAQVVTITGIDDSIVDGNVAYTIITQPAVSTDPGYSTLNAANAAVTNSDNDVAPPVFFGGGGGGVPAAPGVTSFSPFTNGDGLFNLAATANSEDGKAVILIQKGVMARTSENGGLSSIRIAPLTPAPGVQAGFSLIGLAYEMTPSGATFSPSISLTLYYDVTKLPPNTDIGGLAIGLYNASTSRWDILPSVVNQSDSSVTAKIDHFSIYAIIGKPLPAPPVPTTAPPAPAKLTVSALSVLPLKTTPGQPVVATAKVSNSGGTAGEQEVTLKINGTVEASKLVSVPAGGQSDVAFTFTRNTAGSYQVDLNGLTASVDLSNPQPTTTAAPVPTTAPPSTPEKTGGFPGWIVFVALAVVAAAAVLLVASRKRHQTKS